MNVKADTVIRNGRVYTVFLDGDEWRGEAVAFSGGRIAAAGSDEEIAGYIGEDTEVIDAGGNSVLPGFCDAHVHSSFSGSAMFACDLFGLNVRPGKGTVTEKLQRALAEYVEANGGREIIRGCGWDLSDFAMKLPDRKMIDEVCADRPVFLESYCQHHLLLNSKAIEMAGITRETPSPRNGIIYRDRQGAPTGLFSELSAIHTVRDKVPELNYTVEQCEEILRRYQRDFANAYGVTMIFDALSSENAAEAFRRLAKSGELTIRVRDNEYADPRKGESQFDEFIERKGRADVEDLYVRNTVKFFMESTTPDIYFTEAYKPWALKLMKKPKGYRGFPHWTREELERILPPLMEAGFQIHTHAMGDGAVKHTIDGYEYARNMTGKNTRNVIAHLMYVQPEDYRRMSENEIIACVQPTWMAETRAYRKALIMALGKKRVDEFWPYRRFLDAGVTVSAGTDFPVTPPPDPFIEMEHAMTRKLCEAAQGYEGGRNRQMGPKGRMDQDVVSMRDVIRSRTIAGAYQCFAEDITGSIEAGKSADVIVLDRDIENTPIDKIHETKVMRTFFKGRQVYERRGI